jgi:hypothetical protein
MNLTLWLRCGLLAIMALGFLPSQAGGVVLEKGFSHISLTGHVWVSPMSVEITTAQEALDHYKKGDFTALKSNLARGYRKESTWLVFELASQDPLSERVMMPVAPAYTDRITAYQTSPDGALLRIGAAGDQVPQSEKAIVSPVPAFAIDLSDTKQNTVLLRIQTVNTMAAIVTLHR